MKGLVFAFGFLYNGFTSFHITRKRVQMQDKKIIIASDHAGFELKKTLVAHLSEKGYDVTDLGPYTDQTPVDYPDMAALVANDIRTNAPVQTSALLLFSVK